MASTRAPAFQFYPQDFLVGTAIMSAEEVGGYIRLLCYQWEHGSIPNDDAIIARLAGCGGNAVASIRHKFGICDNGNLANKRLEAIREEQREYREKQSSNAKKRWEKAENVQKTCGGIASAHAMALPVDMPKACPSPSSSSSNNTIAQAPLALGDIEQKPRKRNELADALAVACGRNPLEMTAPDAKACAVAMNDIKRVSPEVTPSEINARVQRYRSKFSNAACTPHAISKHWAALGTFGKPQSDIVVRC